MAEPKPHITWADRLRMKRWDFWTGFTVFIYLYLICFVVYPLFSLLLSSLRDPKGSFTLSYYWDFLRLNYYRTALFNSFTISFFAALFALVIGVPLAYAAVRTNIRGKGLLNILVIMSLVSPPFIGAYSWIMLLGNNGLVTRLFHAVGIPFSSIYGPGGIIFVLTLQFYPHIYLYVSGALRSIDTSLEEVAESLGSPVWKRMASITLPLIFPTLSAGALMVFMEAFADFGTPLLLGQGYTVMPVLAYNQFVSEMGGNPSMASTISSLMILCSVLLLSVQRYVSTRRNYATTGMRTPKIKLLSPAVRTILTAVTFVPALISIIPQITVAVTSFIQTKGPVFQHGFSFGSYQEIWYRVKPAIINTYSYSLVAIAITVLLGVLASYVLVRRRSKVTALLDGLLMVPYVVPGTVVGISFILAFNEPPVILTGTWVILVIAYVTRKMSYTIRSSSGMLYQLDRSVEEASISLGVPPVRTFFKTTLRLMLPGVMSGAIISWIAIINELSTTLVLYHGATATITVSVYSEVVTSNYGTGAALATLLSVSALGSLLIANRLSGRRLVL